MLSKIVPSEWPEELQFITPYLEGIEVVWRGQIKTAFRGVAPFTDSQWELLENLEYKHFRIGLPDTGHIRVVTFMSAAYALYKPRVKRELPTQPRVREIEFWLMDHGRARG